MCPSGSWVLRLIFTEKLVSFGYIYRVSCVLLLHKPTDLCPSSLFTEKFMSFSYIYWDSRVLRLYKLRNLGPSAKFMEILVSFGYANWETCDLCINKPKILCPSCRNPRGFCPLAIFHHFFSFFFFVKWRSPVSFRYINQEIVFLSYFMEEIASFKSIYRDTFVLRLY